MKPLLLPVFLIGLIGLIGLTACQSPQSLRQPIYFGFDRWTLTEQHHRQLARKAEILKKNRRIGLTLEGHTDKIGPASYNLRLGDRRARSVKVELVRLGINPQRLIVVSHGESNPRALGNRPQDHALNRRVECVIR